MKALEFYTTPEGEVMIRLIDEPDRLLCETDVDFINEFLDIIQEFYPEAHKALLDVYAKCQHNKRYMNFLMLRRFIKCNFSQFDNALDVSPSERLHFEFISCPLRGECKHDGIISSPKFNSKLTDRQLSIMKMLYDGQSVSEVADKLFLSIKTVDNHRKNSLKKLGLSSMADFMRHVIKTNLFNEL